MSAAAEKSPRRTRRERDIVEATRRLFDERGMQDAPIEEIAREVGIARGLIYRVFSSKEELFVLTVTNYLAELADVLDEAVPSGATPVERLERRLVAYVEFCARYPAFLDCALSLMRRPAAELQGTVSELVWLRLGQGMVRPIDGLARALRDGADAGVLAVEDPEYTANVVWTQILGTMHLARMRVGLRQLAPGVPDLFRIDPEDVKRTCVADVLATVRA